MGSEVFSCTVCVCFRFQDFPGFIMGGGGGTFHLQGLEQFLKQSFNRMEILRGPLCAVSHWPLSKGFPVLSPVRTMVFSCAGLGAELREPEPFTCRHTAGELPVLGPPQGLSDSGA